jgi:hypothetical protein
MKLLAALTSALLLITPGSASLLAQEESDTVVVRNSVYFEGGGYGGLSSVNYDRLIGTSLFIRGGASYVPLDWFGPWSALAIVYGFSLRPGSSRHNVELDAGAVTMLERSESKLTTRIHHLLGVGLGYRYQPLTEGLLFRATGTIAAPVRLTPSQPADESAGYIAIAFSIGYAF